MCVILDNVLRTIKIKWCVTMVTVVLVVVEVASLNGANVCMVKQKYNITKRVKYRAPMSVRTYEWCFSVPPRCSRWSTEMRDLTRLETEERIAEVSVCCPGYKMQDVSCVPICPIGKTGPSCSEGCPLNKWGPNCVHDCKNCSENGSCSPITGECTCKDGWQGESCQASITTTTSTTTMRESLTIMKTTTQTSLPLTKTTIFTTSTTIAPPTTTSTSRPITTTALIPKIEITSPKISSTHKVTTIKPVEVTRAAVLYNNATVPSISTISTFNSISEDISKTYTDDNSVYNRTELFKEITKAIITTEAGIPARRILKPPVDAVMSTISTTRIYPAVTPKIHSMYTTKDTIPYTETTRKPETTIRFMPTTLKFKPKEIWIKPAQKGESPLIDIKTLQTHESHSKPKSSTKKELAFENTTAKTIVVSIIPTSVSYATFKKMALTAASFMPQKNSTVMRTYNQSSEGITKSMSVSTSTSTPFTLKLNTLSLKQLISTTTNPSFSQSVTNMTHNNLTRGNLSNKPTPVYNKTNSMTSTPIVVRLNSSNSLTTTSSTNAISTTLKRDIFHKKAVSHEILNILNTTLEPLHTTEKVTTRKTFASKQFIAHQRNLTNKTEAKETETGSKRNELIESEIGKTNITKQNVTINFKTNNVTVKPDEDEETFHILTEPEHITAVMGDKGTDRTSVDLVSVISIAGGIMMAVITVAVVIVMVERCKRPRYEDVRKINDIRMQVMIDNNDVPPPYVRSIFHTPLPEPPSSEKCHYQPISTLDRNLKQFMRPVVVQTISPVMLENFRGILECHYDHLPRRSQDFGTMPARFNTAPSVIHTELRNARAISVTESTIEALKCEAKLDVIDTTTAEPLYAEIPCWRPPSEHAIEIINMNGEAVTEL